MLQLTAFISVTNLQHDTKTTTKNNFITEQNTLPL